MGIGVRYGTHEQYRNEKGLPTNQRGDGDDNGERRGQGPWVPGPGSIGTLGPWPRVHWDHWSLAQGPLGPLVPGPKGGGTPLGDPPPPQKRALFDGERGPKIPENTQNWSF